MNKPCWKLAKACPQSQKLFCFGENNLLIKWTILKNAEPLPIPSPTDLSLLGLILHHSQNDLMSPQ